MLDFETISGAAVALSPYPFFVVRNALKQPFVGPIADDFPKIDNPGAVPLEDVDCGPNFEALIDDLKSDRFRDLVAAKFDVDLDGRDVVVNLRGQMRRTDGNIHTDSPTKLVTVLMYFNQPGDADGSDLRILRGPGDIDDYVEQVPPLAGTMLAFRVTPECWHGHRPMTGPRKSLQLNYLSGQPRVRKHEGFRRLWAHLVRRAGF